MSEVRFVAIYRWRLKPGQETTFQEGWRRVTRRARAECGALGSALLHEGADRWFAIALWPSEEARDACFKEFVDEEGQALMARATHERIEFIAGDMVDNLWAPLDRQP